MANNVSGFRMIRPILDLKKLNRDKRIKYLTELIPYNLKQADEDCRMIVNQYQHILEGDYWKDVATSPEEYFVKYCDHPVEWFEKLLEGIALLDQSQPIKAQDALDAAKLQATKEAEIVSQGTRTDLLHDNIMKSKCVQGTSREYLLRKIARDYPKVLDEIGEGKKYHSARAAAIAVGILKEKIKIEFPPDESGSQIAGRLFQKLSDQQLMELRDELNEFFRGNK